jgi:hypothetical protein
MFTLIVEFAAQGRPQGQQVDRQAGAIIGVEETQTGRGE